MPCGKRPLVKKWDRPREIQVIKPSRYEQNEASVKVHWKNVIRSLELSYKDESFWESQSKIVHSLVGPKIYRRIEKIFNLPPEETHYEPASEVSSLAPSEVYYQTESAVEASQAPIRQSFSTTDFDYYEYVEEEEEDLEEQQGEPSEWTITTASSSELKRSRSKSVAMMRSKSMSTRSIRMSKSMSKVAWKSQTKSFSRQSRAKISGISLDEPASTLDDLEVQVSDRPARPSYVRRKKNPHFEMLYCNESETDMIKWKSNYKQKTFEVSASDEFSKKAEIMTKKIAKEFYEWWVDLGNVEFKSEIKRPEDIEDLFQVWFDEHASRSLVLEPKILPCVLQSIADYIGVGKLSCPKVLKRQIAYDIHAETSPAHTMAFGTCLPQHMKHLPPRNNTKEMWHGVRIPEDLRSMACVWEDIQHLTSTKSFHTWLKPRPHMPMPPFFKSLEAPGEKKQPFVVPSDYVLRDRSSVGSSSQDLALPVSEFTLELKEVLSKLLN